jgi:hypothetical protein
MHSQEFIEDLSHKRAFCLDLWNRSDFFARDLKDLQVPALLFIHRVPSPIRSNNPQTIWMNNMLSGDKRSGDGIRTGNKTHMLYFLFFQFLVSRMFILHYATSVEESGMLTSLSYYSTSSRIERTVQSLQTCAGYLQHPFLNKQ